MDMEAMNKTDQPIENATVAGVSLVIDNVDVMGTKKCISPYRPTYIFKAISMQNYEAASMVTEHKNTSPRKHDHY